MGNLIKKSIKKLILCGIQAFFHKNKKNRNTARDNIVIIRLDEIGDMVLMSAFLRELRHNYEFANITLVVKPAIYNLVEHCPYVDEVLVFSKKSGRFAWLKNILAAYKFWHSQAEKKNYSLALVPRWDADASYGATMLAFFSGATRRIGYSEKVHSGKAISDAGYDGFFTEVLTENVLKHELERDLDVLRYMGCYIKSKRIENWVTDSDISRTKQLIAQAGGKSQAIRLALFLSAGQKKREFSVQKFADIVKVLREKHAIEVYLLGDVANTLKYAQEFVSIIPEVHNFVGQTTLRETAAFIAQCDLYLGGDTGPMHLAAATGIRGLALFVARASWQKNGLNTPERFGPWSDKIITLAPESPLPGCEEGCYKNYAHCINTISIDEIVSSLDKMCYEVENNR